MVVMRNLNLHRAYFRNTEPIRAEIVHKIIHSFIT